MRYLFPIVLVSFALLGGCASYSLDMSGLEGYSNDHLDDASERYSMSTLDHLSDSSMGRASENLTMSDLERASNHTLDEVASRYSIIRLEHASNETMDPISEDLSMSELDRLTSETLDPDTLGKR
ncbi:MAG: hypothetical protein KDB82_05480 [Planctomycetes bacterium]|nr:hypothetical protein [Planctomycetota bacterium]